jgi:hypothetical protein
MKKIGFFLMITLLCVGCSKGDDDIKNEPEDVISPLYMFGSTKQSIKKAEFRELYDDTGDVLIYQGREFVEYVLYAFDEQGKNNGASILTETIYTTELAGWISKNFVSENLSDGTIFLTLKSNSNICGLVDVTTYNSSDYYLVTLIDVRHVSSSAKFNDKIKDKMDECIKYVISWTEDDY